MKTNMICICCPLGCNMNIVKSDLEYLVSNNKCPRGKKYAIEEVTTPKRVITSTIKIINGIYTVIPVKTDQPAPKEKVFTIMKILASVTVEAPIKIGDVIVENVAGTEVNIIATKTDEGRK